ncbi:MAG: thiol:disulfide interchange protein DsbA/DsbL [Lysobacterales bacterium]|jgi:thiol:disulfide interchange protein DsbA
MLKNLLLASLLVLAGQTALAQNTAFEEGKHYSRINQASAPRADGKVEVIVVFSYLCSHCNVLEPYVEAWSAKQNDSIVVNRMHVNFGRAHELLARGYIVAEMTGVVEQSHPAMMDAIWKERKRFRSPDDLAKFYTQFGLDEERFMSNFGSFAADSQLRRIEQNTRAWGITGTPAIIVNRKYRVPNTAMVWDVVDYLVAQELTANGP